ncbi:hypothetical protein GCM10007937_47490 [Mesorhizobium albiziae]|nr:hypothetical protein GCM10007937_47490 [Mesorhizobium albiziae]
MGGFVERLAETIEYAAEQVPAGRYHEGLSRWDHFSERGEALHFSERCQDGDIALHADDFSRQFEIVLGIAESAKVTNAGSRRRRTDYRSNDLKDTAADVHCRRLRNCSFCELEETIDVLVGGGNNYCLRRFCWLGHHLCFSDIRGC